MTTDSGSGPLAPDLRSMLSRAVETELGEQRELTDAVTAIRVQLARLNDEVSGLRHHTSNDGVSSGQLNTMTVELREAVRLFNDRLDRVSRAVSERAEDLTDIRTSLTVLDAHVRSQAETIASLSAGMLALPSYNDRVSVLQDNLQVLHRQLVGIEGSLSAADAHPIDDRLVAIESALANLTFEVEPDDSLDERLASIETALDRAAQSAQHVGLDPSLDTRLAAIEAALSTAALAPEPDPALDERLGAIEAALDGLTTAHTTAAEADSGLDEDLDERLVAIEAALTALTAAHAASASAVEADSGLDEDLDERLAAIEAALTAIPAPVLEPDPAVNARLGAIETAVGTLQSQIQPIATDITAIGGEVAGIVESAADTTAMDHRVSEIVNYAVRESERRVLLHVDEAIVALAQTLLKRRSALGGPDEGSLLDQVEVLSSPDPLGTPDPVSAVVDDGPSEPAAAPTAAGSGDTTLVEGEPDAGTGGALGMTGEPADGAGPIDRLSDWAAETEIDFWATPSSTAAAGAEEGLPAPTSLSDYRNELAPEPGPRAPLDKESVAAAWSAQAAGADPAGPEAGEAGETSRRRKRLFGRD